jgi:YfiH family protein
MPFKQSNGIEYFEFANLAAAGRVTQAIFTRKGGVSPEPWASLNLGATVGDALENVQENRKRSFAALGRNISSLYDSWLVHSTTSVYASEPRAPETPHVKADIILTDRPEVSLYMRYADCVPILLYDPIRHVVCLAHAGWVGTLNRVAAAAVSAMQTQFGTRAGDLLAGIGPSICVDHYPVGDEVIQKVRQTFGAEAEQVIARHGEQSHLDLWKANQIVLWQAGVSEIEISGLCTAGDTTRWYSHRAEHGKTGRFGALLALND